jgi:peptide/nickel transport system substrate-binding protein
MRSTKSPSPAAISTSRTPPPPRRGAAPQSTISATRVPSPKIQHPYRIFCLLLLLFLPHQLQATKHPKFGGTLRLELQIAKVSLDPREWKSGSPSTAENETLATLIYDRLLTLDEYGRFQPALATEWSHDASSKNWQFKLRTDVEFSDGSPLAPKDVVAALQPLLGTGLQISITENGVLIRSAHPVPDLLEQLASGRYFIYHSQSDGALLGTGPFVLAESSPAAPSEVNPATLKPARMKFRANEDAWAGRPFLDSIEVTLGNPALRQILNLQVGRADIIDIPPDLVRKARQDNLRVWNSPPATLLALRFDEDQPTASNARLREALDLALDRDTMANVLLQRQALPTAALLPQWLSGYAFLFDAPMDLNRAKQIRSTLPANLAGVADPLRLRVDGVGDLMKLLGERIAVNARQANIAVQLVPHASPSSPSVTPATGLHLFVWRYNSLTPRTELLDIAHYLHSETTADTIAVTTDTEKLYAEERRLVEERQILPLLLLPNYVGIAPNVRNWTVAPSGEWRLADVWLDSGEPAASNTAAPQGRTAVPGVQP